MIQKILTISVRYNRPRFFILGVLTFTTGCSFIFPKQFENFSSPEQIEALESEKHNHTHDSDLSVSPNSETKSSRNSRDTIPTPHSKKRVQPLRVKNKIPTIKPAEIYLRDSIEVGLDERQAVIQLQTPQPIQISFSGKLLKLGGNSQFKACGVNVCTPGTSGAKKLAPTIQIYPKYDFLKYQSHHYRGIFIIKNIKGQLALVNKLEVEEYLRGVLPHEIGVLGEWGYEALKAQSVAARTYTYKHLDRRRKNGFDIYADTRDQMYLGALKEYPLSNNAIEATRGQVLTYDSKLIQAFYHSTCGGQTADISQVWNSDHVPYLVTRSDKDSNGKAWCAPSRLFAWEYRMSGKYFDQQIAKNARKASTEINSTLNSPQLRILKRSPSGRVKSARLSSDGKSYQIIGDKTRWLLKPPHSNLSILPSSKVKMDYHKGQWHIHGSGFGHGIGLCQFGARERSRAGQSYLEILGAYYTDVEISIKTPQPQSP